MGATYVSKDVFERDLKEAEEFLPTIVQIGDTLRIHIHEYLQAKGIGGHIEIVGSTNPARLTAVFDPRSPDDRYPCDFDIAVVPDRDLDAQESSAILTEMYPQGKMKETHGRTELTFLERKFPVSMGIVNPSEAKENLPIQYSLRSKGYSETQKRTMRGLRLYAMRNGLYGGFTRGFKGVALEQMAEQHGDFNDVMGWIHSQLPGEGPYALDVRSPVAEEANLVRNVSPQVFARLANAADAYAQTGMMRNLPYSVDAWEADHAGSMNFTLSSSDEDPRDAYFGAERTFKRTLASISKGCISADEVPRDVFVVPHQDRHEVFISVKLKDICEREFRKNFFRRWDARTT